jgi:hypothetical protein
MDWRTVANAPWLWLCGGVQAAIGLFQAVYFYRLAVRMLTRHGGYTPVRVRSLVRAAVITAIGPVLAEILVMMALVVAISPAWAWQREGVGVGSVATEMVLVSSAAAAVGQTVGQPGFDLVGFATAVVVVNVSCTLASLGAAFFTRYLGRARDRISGGDVRLLAVLGVCSTLGIFAFFAAGEIKRRGGRELAVITGAALSMLLFTLADRLRVPRLKEWALGIATFGGMHQAHLLRI